MRGLLGRDGDGQRLRIGVADVLGREPHQPPRDVERILARLEHPREPVHRGVGVAVAHRLVQRGDEVVVLFAGLVVEQHPALDRLFRELRQIEPPHGRRPVVGADAAASSSRFSADRASPLANRAIARERLVVDIERLRAEAALAVGERAPQDDRAGRPRRVR